LAKEKWIGSSIDYICRYKKVNNERLNEKNIPGAVFIGG
jgi:hypothetical protein